MSKPTIRSSSVPTLMTCTPAVLNPDGLVAVEQENETALLGTLVHALCQKLVDTGSYDLMSIKDRLNEADFDRAGMLFNNFLTVWREAQPYMKKPQTEVAFDVELSHCRLTGHIDCIHFDPARAFVLDYKTGRTHEDHYHQMAAYARGAWELAGKPPAFTVYVTVVYLEDNAVHNYTFSVENLREWEQEFEGKLRDTRYVAGRKCAHCTLQGSCPAYRDYGRAGIALLGEFTVEGVGTPTNWETLTPEERGNIVDHIYVVEKAIDRVKLTLRNTVKSKGSVDIGGGKEYVLIEQEEKQVDARRALPVLENHIDGDAIKRHVRLPLDAVLSEYAAKAARGQKTVARKELFAKLDAAGAIVRTKITKMWRRPKGEKTLEVT